MTGTQKLKRIYMLLRWYDSYAADIIARKDEVPEEDLKLALTLEKEMHELQAEALRVKKKNKTTSQTKILKTKPKN
jgi:hypothetical protein